MSTARSFAYSPEKAGPAQKELLKLHEKINSHILKMEKDKNHMTKQEELNKYAEQIITIINKYHAEVVKWESFLKAAIVDLTEVPSMQPQMQRIAILTAMKDACTNIQSFLDTSTR